MLPSGSISVSGKTAWETVVWKQMSPRVVKPDLVFLREYDKYNLVAQKINIYLHEGRLPSYNSYL